MLTVPSSSMLISQPDSSTRRLMFLPPGPMRAPIFSGLILTLDDARGVFAQFRARSGDGLGHFGQDVEAGDAGFFQGFGHDVVGNAAEFEVQLEAGDAVCGAGDFAIHVAEAVFPADDVGEEFVARMILSWSSCSVQMPMLMPATGRIMGTPASMRAREAPQTVAIEVEPLDSMISLVTRMA